MTKKSVLTSLMSIAMLASIASGATYALFTAEDSTNIAVTSAKVSVEATVENLTVYSMDKLMEGIFENGGTAIYEKGVLTLDKMTPGDKVEFDIKVKNNSNVDIQYRLNWSIEGKLSEVLDVKADGDELKNVPWAEWKANATEKEKVIDVVVELPINVGNNYQDQVCDIEFKVEAVQGNVTISDFSKVNTSVYANDYESLVELKGQDGDIVLLDDVVANDYLFFGNGTQVNLDLNGKTITAQNTNQYALVTQNGGKLVLDGEGTIDCGKGFYANKEGAEVVINSGTYNMSVSGTLSSMKHHSVIQNNAKAVINGGTFTSSVVDCAIFFVTSNATLEVNGGFFENTIDATPDYFNMGTNRSNVNRVILKGGTFVNWNPLEDRMCYTGEWPANGYEAFSGPWMIVWDGYEVVSQTQPNGDIWYSVVEK